MTALSELLVKPENDFGNENYVRPGDIGRNLATQSVIFRRGKNRKHHTRD